MKSHLGKLKEIKRYNKMILNYKTNAQNHIDYQLYAASKSERIAKKRKAAKIYIPIIYLSISFVLLIGGFYIGSCCSLIFAILWYLIYPIYLSKHYVKHYSDFVNERIKNEPDYTTNIEFTKEFIFIKSEAGESKLNSTEIKEIIEISTITMVFLKLGTTLLFPNDAIKNISELKSFLKTYSKDLNIEYKQELNWKWK